MSHQFNSFFFNHRITLKCYLDINNGMLEMRIKLYSHFQSYLIENIWKRNDIAFLGRIILFL